MEHQAIPNITNSLFEEPPKDPDSSGSEHPYTKRETVRYDDNPDGQIMLKWVGWTLNDSKNRPAYRQRLDQLDRDGQLVCRADSVTGHELDLKRIYDKWLHVRYDPNNRPITQEYITLARPPDSNNGESEWTGVFQFGNDADNPVSLRFILTTNAISPCSKVSLGIADIANIRLDASQSNQLEIDYFLAHCSDACSGFITHEAAVVATRCVITTSGRLAGWEEAGPDHHTVDRKAPEHVIEKYAFKRSHPSGVISMLTLSTSRVCAGGKHICIGFEWEMKDPTRNRAVAVRTSMFPPGDKPSRADFLETTTAFRSDNTSHVTESKVSLTAISKQDQSWALTLRTPKAPLTLTNMSQAANITYSQLTKAIQSIKIEQPSPTYQRATVYFPNTRSGQVDDELSSRLDSQLTITDPPAGTSSQGAAPQPSGMSTPNTQFYGAVNINVGGFAYGDNGTGQSGQPPGVTLTNTFMINNNIGWVGGNFSAGASTSNSGTGQSGQPAGVTSTHTVVSNNTIGRVNGDFSVGASAPNSDPSDS